MTTQIAVKLADTTVAAVDRLVDSGRIASRSEAVRLGLDHVVRTYADAEIDRSFATGFRRLPETASELADAERLAGESIAEEPWEKWW